MFLDRCLVKLDIRIKNFFQQIDQQGFKFPLQIMVIDLSVAIFPDNYPMIFLLKYLFQRIYGGVNRTG